MMKVYISGKVTGEDYSAAVDKFWKAERHLVHEGHQPINPLKLDHTHCISWTDFMMVDILSLLSSAEAIYMLDGWGESRGARIEYAIAKELGLNVFFETCNAAISKSEVKQSIKP